MIPSKVTCTHHGIEFTVEWRDDESWWATMGSYSFPVSRDRDANVIDEVCSRYIGDPPPSDMSAIWGGYKCADCGAEGVRLWREYQTFLDHPTLRCRACSEEHEGKDLSGDQIGGLMPAVPSHDGETFWGYTSVPKAAANWWRSLPTSHEESD